MARTSTYVPDSDEEQRTDCGRKSNTVKPKGGHTKRARSRSPSTQSSKRTKTNANANAKDTAGSQGASKKSKTNPPLTLEAQAAKNAAARLSTIERRKAAPAKEELAASIERIKKSISGAYATFELPKLVKPAVKGEKYTMHAFVCKSCRERVNRPIGDSGTSSLLKHQTRCELRKHQGILTDYGITGSSVLTNYDVREYAALWISEDGQSFATIEDRYLQKLMPCEVVKMLPHRKTLVRDIITLYRMTQKSIKTMLSGIVGALHIALDLCQAANGHDYLGIVVFYPVVKDNSLQMERFVLECLNFAGKHTGVALANAVYQVLQHFDIHDRVWGVVCDNASNNGDMMNRFKKFKMRRLTGPVARVHCVPHILNLTSKAIAAPFVRKRAEAEATADGEADEQADTLSGSDEGDEDDKAGATDDDDFDFHAEDETGEDDGTAPSRTLDQGDEGDDEGDDDDDLADVFVPEMIAGSREAKELKGALKALYKIAWLARKLRFSPRFRDAFQDECAGLGLPTPHNIPRDVSPRWNSTAMMIKEATRLEAGILAFQKSGEVPAKKRLSKEEFKAMKLLLRLLQPLTTLTEILSRANVPMLADTLVHYDSLNHEYTHMAEDETLPLWARQAANRARLKWNKYYAITDSSHLYRLAILLHPSNRQAYLLQLDWKPEWIEEASDIAVDYWSKYYKPDDYANGDDTSSQSQFGYSSFAENIYGSLADENDKPVDPVTGFITGKPTLERTKGGRVKPVNPLAWWYAQRLAGDEHYGLTQMALDVLGAPATSVEVEQAFSFVSNLVSKRRHNMSAYTVQSTASLGAYSRANLVPAGTLAKAHHRAREKAQATARAKAAKAQMQAAEAEAAAIAAGAESEEETEDGEEDDDDVLDASSDINVDDLED